MKKSKVKVTEEAKSALPLWIGGAVILLLLVGVITMAILAGNGVFDDKGNGSSDYSTGDNEGNLDDILQGL